MLIKRHLNCHIIISNGYHCLICARAKKTLKQRKTQLLNNSSKRATIKKIPKTRKKFELLQKKNELQRKQKNRCLKKIKLLKKDMDEL